MNIAQNVKKALAPVGLAGLVFLASACATSKPTVQMDNGGNSIFGFPRSNGVYETLTILPGIENKGERAIATLVGGADGSFYTVWGSCDGKSTLIGPMYGVVHHSPAGSAPNGQEALYNDFQKRLAEMMKASGGEPDCSYKS